MKTPNIEHHIQRDIIVRLSKAESLRFSDLKPEKLENNHFMYHLNLLIKNGLIEKAGSQYLLAPSGLTYVDQLSYKNRRPRRQPKIIAVLVIKNSRSQYLLANRKIQPYFGYAMLPSGKQHYGESLLAHAKRELREKTGLEAKIEARGYVSIIISKQEQIISHVIAHVFEGKIKVGEKVKQNDERFELFWVDYEKLPEVRLMPGTKEIIDLVNKPNQELFFESLEYSMP